MLYSSVYTRVPARMVSVMKGSMVFCFTFASRLMTTCPPRCIIPKMGGLSFSMVPRPLLPGSDIHVMLALRRRSRQVVVTNEQFNGPDMIGELLGKGQRVAHQPGHALAQC